MKMYNLLITSQDRAWEESPYFLYETSRFLEYTDDELRVQFEKLDVAAIARICAMPALFMYEEEVDEPGFVGRITAVKRDGRGLYVSFELDRSKRFEWSDFDGKLHDLGIFKSFELARTHWAIKDVDLDRAIRLAPKLPEVSPVAPVAVPELIPARAPGPMPSETQAPRPISIFISYSHKDTQYLKLLRTHLKPLERDAVIDVWDDSRIPAGARWKDEISATIDSARIAIFIVSADFLASDFIASSELPPLLKAAESKGTTIVSLIARPCLFHRSALAEFQAANDPAKPLSSLTKNSREAVVARLAEQIAVLVEKWIKAT